MRSVFSVRTLIVLATLVVAGASSARSATMSVLSVNTLHLGWGKPTYQSNKNAYFKDNYVAKNYDVVLLQEVMPKLGGLSTIWTGTGVGEYDVYQSGALGKSSYRETYGILVKNQTNFTVLPYNGYNMTCYTGTGFSRPPCAVLLKTGSVGTWFADYHAVFGTVNNRKAEVGNIPTVVTTYAGLTVSGVKYGRVVVGGDWNFSATEIGNIFTINGSMTPDVKTSLNPKGVLSSQYDHFYCIVATCSGAAAITAPPTPYNTLPSYRMNVSDHVGVTISVAY